MHINQNIHTKSLLLGIKDARLFVFETNPTMLLFSFSNGLLSFLNSGEFNKFSLILVMEDMMPTGSLGSELLLGLPGNCTLFNELMLFLLFSFSFSALGICLSFEELILKDIYMVFIIVKFKLKLKLKIE